MRTPAIPPAQAVIPKTTPLAVPMTWALAFSAATLLVAASTIAVVILTYTPLPKWDHWAEILWLKHYYAGQWHLSDLWRQHNEHRIFFPRLFLLADWFLFRGTNVFLLCSILLLQAAHAWIFLREVRAWKELSAAVRLTVAAIIVILFFSGANLDNFTWPFQISFILAFYAGTASLYALIRYAESGRTGWLALSAGCAIVATHSLANGLLIWPVLLLAVIVLRLSRRLLLGIGILFVLVVGQFFSGYRMFPGHANALAALRHPLAVLDYVGAYLALPLTRIDHAIGVAAGLLALAAFAWCAFRLLRRPARPRLVVLSLGVMLYIAAGAFLTALGRMAVSPPETSLRYATPASIFWACALLAALAAAGTFPQKSAAVAAVLASAITSLIAIAPLHLDRCVASLQLAGSIREIETALRVNVIAKNRIAAIYPDPDAAFSLIDVLREHHRSLFATQTPITVGELLPADFQVVGRDRCRGAWEIATTLEDTAQPGSSASGWAWDTVAGRRPDEIVFMDDSRLIRGLAAFTRAREDVATVFHNSRMASGGWFGFIRGISPTPPRAYALLSGGRLCPLINPSELPRPDYAVFRNGQWFIDSQRTGAWDPRDRMMPQFGIPGDIPVTGDWDGSGVIRAGVFRGGEWLLDWNNNGRWDSGDRQFNFGAPGDLPVTGDWNHNGVTKVGVFRNGVWILDWNGEQRYGPGARQFNFGAPGDIPVTGDWNGSGATHIGVFRRGTWYLDNGDFQLDSHDQYASFGLPDDQPVTGDWSGLGMTKIGVFRNGHWIVDSTGTFNWDPNDASVTFGLPGDRAVPWKK